VDDDVQIDGDRIITSNPISWNLADSQTSSLNIESGLLNLDTSNSRIGIGTTSPQRMLHIYEGNAGTDPAWLGNDIVMIESDGSAYLQFFVPDSSAQSGILMSNPSGRAAGGVFYKHDVDKIYFRSNSGNNMVLDSSGNVGIGTTGPITTLDVDGGFATNIITIDQTDDGYTPLTTDYTILVDADSATADVDIDLPAASDREGQILVIKRIDDNPTYDVVINRAGSDLIDGVISKTLDAQWKSLTIQSDGSDWFILSIQP
jgi:hypothetical protein